MRELLPNDKETDALSKCCKAKCHLTNGHVRKDDPDTISTWWYSCTECGKPCDVLPK